LVTSPGPEVPKAEKDISFSLSCVFEATVDDATPTTPSKTLFRIEDLITYAGKLVDLNFVGKLYVSPVWADFRLKPVDAADPTVFGTAVVYDPTTQSLARQQGMSGAVANTPKTRMHYPSHVEQSKYQWDGVTSTSSPVCGLQLKAKATYIISIRAKFVLMADLLSASSMGGIDWPGT